MKILAVSDRVMAQLYSTQVTQFLPKIDLIISCGDLPFYYLEFLVSVLDVPLFFVRGNHDTTPQYTMDGRVLHTVHGGEDIHGRIIQERGLFLAGLEGSMRYRPKAPLMYSENEMRWQARRLWPRLLMNRLRTGRGMDIMVTHSPPFQVHDRQDLAHTGFRSFLSLIRLFRPRYLLHGHIHIYRQDVVRISRVIDTLVINVYPYHVLDYYAPPEPQQVLT